MLIKTAVRNVFRNRRRTLFSLTVIVVGFLVLTSVLGFVAEALQSTKIALATESGAVQVAAASLFEGTSSAFDDLIPPEIVEQVLSALGSMPGVSGTSLQLSFAGLAGDESGSTLILGRGVVPCSDVDDLDCLVSSGRPLTPSSDREVVLGRALARKLGVAPGDRINIATGTVTGNFNAATVEVVGVMTYAFEEVERQLGMFPITFVQRLLKTDGVARILIGLDDLDQADAFASELQAKMTEIGVPLASRTWEELNPTYGSIQSFYRAFSGLAIIGVCVLVFFSVLEVLTISFLERSREIGTLRAFGTPRGRVFAAFVTEGIALGVLGTVLGGVLSATLLLLFNQLGFTWTPPGAALPQVIRVQLSGYVLAIPSVTIVVSTLLSALFPSWRTSRVQIVDALRSV